MDDMKLTQEEYDRIEDLLECALSSGSKKAAEPYLNQMNSMSWNESGNLRTLLDTLHSSASEGSKRNSDYGTFARQDLSKLRQYVERQ